MLFALLCGLQFYPSSGHSAESIPAVTEVCKTANTSPVCAAKTWWVCRVEGKWCASVGLPNKDVRHTLEYEQYLAELYREHPERRVAHQKTKEAPWAAPFNDVLDLSAGENDVYDVVAVKPVSADRYGAERALPKELANAVEVVIAHTAVDDYSNDSVFLKKSAAGWGVVGWHSAETSLAGARFGEAVNPLGVWSETCKPQFAGCAMYIYGLPPYEKYMALSAQQSR